MKHALDTQASNGASPSVSRRQASRVARRLISLSGHMISHELPLELHLTLCLTRVGSL